METAAFVVLALMALVSAVVVVTHRHAIVAALALAFNLISIAGLFFVLNAQFIGFLQVIVYAGAIMVLILFVLMLLNVQAEASLRTVGVFQRLFAPLAVLALALLVAGGGFVAAEGDRFPPVDSDFGSVERLGVELFTRFWYPFEAISLLLVVAMIGAVLLAKRRL